MDWVTHIFEGPSYEGQYHGYNEDDRYWNHQQPSADEFTDHEREEIDYAIALSLSEEDWKGKNVIDHEKEREQTSKAQLEEDERRAKALLEEDRKRAQLEEDERRAKALLEEDRKRAQLEEDELLAKALQESLTVESPTRPGGNLIEPHPISPFSGLRICTACNGRIGLGRFLNCMDAVWHPECFRCHACGLPITNPEFSLAGKRPYHKSCYKENHHPRCDVCKNHIPRNGAGLIEYRAHPFWMQKYCPSHERDGTPRCCSCERLEPRDHGYISLDDGRRLCLECLDSAIMDTNECQPLYLAIREFYEGLNMKVDQQIPLLLVERQALNEAIEGEKNGHHHMPETRGLCLSEEQCVTTVIRRPRIGAGYPLIPMITEPYKLVRSCEVTAILILYGLPRLLTGSILAHEMMHAWLRLNGFPNLRPEVEEGICQVLAHMWLDSEIYSSPANDAASSSSSSASFSSKKGKRPDYEKQLGDFFKHQIESDTSTVYGEGFRSANKSVEKYGLKSTLDHIRITGIFPL
ncbi:hypothetical protein EUGRSUZ_H04968 [Eucalyptus grandis]|uniref:LIM zinc-binding domain-containing protein n=3 Tax=Eucalyptus grandis TaxID=71139 RepID=A0A059B8F3_EUCGR|nr:hypothetical protein EUGRSUZ_H04968 [Eucalyptus grandis]KAK3419256.1 hypothetical protein EUGRSUZ_H04968 [Eucalyptus grandis]